MQMESSRQPSASEFVFSHSAIYEVEAEIEGSPDTPRVRQPPRRVRRAAATHTTLPSAQPLICHPSPPPLPVTSSSPPSPLTSFSPPLPLTSLSPPLPVTSSPPPLSLTFSPPLAPPDTPRVTCPHTHHHSPSLADGSFSMSGLSFSSFDSDISLSSLSSSSSLTSSLSSSASSSSSADSKKLFLNKILIIIYFSGH